MDTKITLEVKNNKSKINYKPTLDEGSMNALLNNLLNNFPAALLNILVHVPMLRPACSEEKDNFTYVFLEGEKGETENKLYKYRKHMYNTLVSIFGQILSTAFPDIEYIESCEKYLQEFCVEHTPEEVAELKTKLAGVATYVRDNFEEVIKEITEEAMEEVMHDA